MSKLMLFKPGAELKSFETREALPFEGNAPKPLVRPRRTYVTLERAMRLGKTPGCKGCAKVAEAIQMNAMKDSLDCLNMKKQPRRRSDHLLPPVQQCPLCSRKQMHVQLRTPNKMKRVFGNSMKTNMCWKGIHVQPRKRLLLCRLIQTR